jgi:hypothetical protein
MCVNKYKNFFYKNGSILVPLCFFMKIFKTKVVDEKNRFILF